MTEEVVIEGWRLLAKWGQHPYIEFRGFIGGLIESKLSPPAECSAYWNLMARGGSMSLFLERNDHRFHPAPGWDCFCGYYIARNVPEPDGSEAMIPHILARCQGLGPSIEHEHGWRVQQVLYLMFYVERLEGIVLDAARALAKRLEIPLVHGWPEWELRQAI